MSKPDIKVFQKHHDTQHNVIQHNDTQLEGLIGLFQRNLMFAGEARSLTRLGWKGLPGTNTLAYYKNP